MRLTNAQLVRCLALLEVSPGDVRAIRLARTREAGEKAREALLAKVSKRWKALALELHPDRTGGDAQKEELFKNLGSVVDELAGIQVGIVRPRPPVRVVQQTWGYAPTSSTTSYTGFPGINIVINVRGV